MQATIAYLWTPQIRLQIVDGPYTLHNLSTISMVTIDRFGFINHNIDKPCDKIWFTLIGDIYETEADNPIRPTALNFVSDGNIIYKAWHVPSYLQIYPKIFMISKGDADLIASSIREKLASLSSALTS